MADLAYLFFMVGLDPVVAAYKAGRDAILAQIDKSDAFEDRLREDIEAGKVERHTRDPETGHEHDAIEYAYYDTVIARETLNQHAQAFTVMLHHAWEKYVCNVNGWPKYKLKDVYYILSKEGWSINRDGLERLRKATNCIKHIDTELYLDHPEMFDLSKVNIERDGIGSLHEALRVTDQDIDDFIRVLQDSAYRPNYRSMMTPDEARERGLLPS
jgi:hypothetical protein